MIGVLKDGKVEVEIGEAEVVAMMTGGVISVVIGKVDEIEVVTKIEEGKGVVTMIEDGIGVVTLIEDEEEVAIVTEADILDEVHRHPAVLRLPPDHDHETIANKTPISVQIRPRNINRVLLLLPLVMRLRLSHLAKLKEMMTSRRFLTRIVRPPSILTSSNTPPRSLIKCLERKLKLQPPLPPMLEPSQYLHRRAAATRPRKGRWSTGIN